MKHEYELNWTKLITAGSLQSPYNKMKSGLESREWMKRENLKSSWSADKNDESKTVKRREMGKSKRIFFQVRSW